MVFDLQYTLIAPQVMSLLCIRGTSVPAVNWSEGSSSAAREQLEALDDQALFEGATIQDQTMVWAIRALLYMKTGLIGDVQMHAAMAPPRECMYITALALRHKGQADEAKSLFQKLKGHPVYQKLKECVKGRLATEPRGHIKRFSDIVEFNGDWEPYAFIDLCSYASDGALDDFELDYLRHVQLDEFNLLFAHCYEIATGLDVLQAKSPESQSSNVAA